MLAIREPGVNVTWSYGLYELDERYACLVFWIRLRLALTPLLLLSLSILDLGEFLMVRKHLLGIKQRAEAAAERHGKQ